MDSYLHRWRQHYWSIPGSNAARSAREIQIRDSVLKNDKTHHPSRGRIRANDRWHSILDSTSWNRGSSPDIPRVHHNLLHMDSPTSLLHRHTRFPAPSQSRERPHRRRTRQENNEDPGNIDPLPPNRPPSIRRVGNLELA